MNEHLGFATLLVEIGELEDAEAETFRALQDHPDDDEALSLLAKIKHIRGELSQAFACWAQGRAATVDGAAQMRLESMLQLVTDPVRGAGEYLAVGQSHLWRKPVVFLKLEEVFRLFVARRPDEARMASSVLARDSRGKDLDMYKLAVLAEAWIAELSGDLAGACSLLEQLGQERGFEGDVDRSLALARIYEQLGDREHLEKAVNVCGHLSRTLQAFDRVATLGRLAALHRALGDGEDAATYERRFLTEFQHHMHRLSLAETTSVAARRYIPIDRLMTIRFTDNEPPDHPTPRRRALALALLGEHSRATELLRNEGALLDRKYLADLMLAEGHPESAVHVYLSALRADPAVGGVRAERAQVDVDRGLGMALGQHQIGQILAVEQRALVAQQLGGAGVLSEERQGECTPPRRRVVWRLVVGEADRHQTVDGDVPACGDRCRFRQRQPVHVVLEFGQEPPFVGRGILAVAQGPVQGGKTPQGRHPVEGLQGARQMAAHVHRFLQMLPVPELLVDPGERQRAVHVPLEAALLTELLEEGAGAGEIS